MTDMPDLRAEARALARFIIGCEPGTELVERYVSAHEHLFRELVPAGELAVVSLAVRRRVLLPCLDAAAALVHPKALLHRKALLMAAVLEASPRHAEAFLPRRTGWVALVAIGAWAGVASAVQITIGLPFLWFVGRKR